MLGSRRDVGGREERGRVTVKLFDVETILVHFCFESGGDLCPLGLLKLLVLLPNSLAELGMGERKLLALGWCGLLNKNEKEKEVHVHNLDLE